MVGCSVLQRGARMYVLRINVQLATTRDQTADVARRRVRVASVRPSGGGIFLCLENRDVSAVWAT